jgi:hypothetical protein
MSTSLQKDLVIVAEAEGNDGDGEGGTWRRLTAAARREVREEHRPEPAVPEPAGRVEPGGGGAELLVGEVGAVVVEPVADGDGGAEVEQEQRSTAQYSFDAQKMEEDKKTEKGTERKGGHARTLRLVHNAYSSVATNHMATEMLSPLKSTTEKRWRCSDKKNAC